MLFVVRFTDDPNRLSIRQQFMSDHLKWLEAHSDVVLVAGSLRKQLAENPVGACWVVESESKEQVEVLLKTDPFWLQGLRESFEVFHWMKAFPQRRVAV